MCLCFFFFFFQAEDGIRDKLVTGVQTCALPISEHLVVEAAEALIGVGLHAELVPQGLGIKRPALDEGGVAAEAHERSEERRVGKSVDLGGRRIRKKKKKECNKKGVRQQHY